MRLPVTIFVWGSSRSYTLILTLVPPVADAMSDTYRSNAFSTSPSSSIPTSATVSITSRSFALHQEVPMTLKVGS